MSTIASEWRKRRLGDTVQRSQPISGEVRRGAASTLSAVALSALSAALVWAQQNPQRVQEVPAAAPALVSPTSPSRAAASQDVSHWQQALVARLDRFKRLSGAGPWGRGRGQPRLHHRSKGQRPEQQDRDDYRFRRSRCGGAGAGQARRAVSAPARRSR
jgi:hypothetical protein